jgi:hypothetical protein
MLVSALLLLECGAALLTREQDTSSCSPSTANRANDVAALRRAAIAPGEFFATRIFALEFTVISDTLCR